MPRSSALLTPLALVALSLQAQAQLGQWVELDELTLARQEAGAERIGDRVYVVGGQKVPFSPTAKLEILDLSLGTWSNGADMPSPLDHSAVAALGGQLYAAGGIRLNFTASDEFFRYDPGADQWSVLQPLPAKRAAGELLEEGGKLYFFGGESGGGNAHAHAWAYDVGLDTWSSIAPMPSIREHLGGVTLDGKLHLIGGRVGTTSVADHHLYDPLTDSWTSLAPLPTVRSGLAVAALGQNIFVMGGEFPSLSFHNEVYDLTTDSWLSLSPLPVPRHGVPGVALDDAVLLPGGGLVQGFFPTDHVDSYVPPTLIAMPPSISLATGGLHSFHLHAGAAQAGRVYLLMGSASGTAPGLPINSVVLPLNPDGWSTFSLAQANQPPFANTLGSLDASGRALASLNVPPGLPASLAGLTLDHAYIVFNGIIQVVLASDAQPLTLVP